MGALNSVLQKFGGYNASGAFSLEFCARPESPEGEEIPLGEHFFLHGLTRYSQSYTFKVNATQTFGGASIYDFGNGFVPLQLSGEIWAYRVGQVITKSQGVFDTASKLLYDAAGVGKTGYNDLFDLLWLLWESRDSNLSDSRSPSSSLFAGQGNGASDIYSLGLDNGLMPFNSQNVIIYFRDYDTGKKFECVFDKSPFNVSQTAEDPLSWRWQLNLLAIRDASGAKQVFIPPLPDITGIIPGLKVLIDDLFQTVSGTLESFAEISGVVNQIKMLKTDLSLSLEAFEEDKLDSLNLIRRNTGILRKKNNKLESLIYQYYLPGIDREAYFNEAHDNTKIAVDPYLTSSQQLNQTIARLEAGLNQQQAKINSLDIVTAKVPAGIRTWEDLALYYFGDVTKAAELRKIQPTGRAASPAELQTVRLPGRKAEIQNIIHSNLTPVPDTFGRDLAKTSDGDIAIAPDGDLAKTHGIQTLLTDLEDMLRYFAGSVPLHPTWGVRAAPGDLPSNLKINSIVLHTIESVQNHPSVKSANLQKLEALEGKIYMQITVRPIGSPEEIILHHTRTVSGIQ